MKRLAWVLPCALALTLTLTSCVGGAPVSKDAAPPPPAEPPTPGLTVPGTIPSPMAVPKPAGATEAKEAKTLTLEEVQARRDMEKQLEEAVADYWGLVGEKNVQEALGYVLEAYRDTVRNELYKFNADYRLTGVDIKEKSVNYDGMPQAEVTVSLTVFEKTSVAPVRKEAVQKWRHAAGRWFVIPGK